MPSALPSREPNAMEDYQELADPEEKRMWMPEPTTDTEDNNNDEEDDNDDEVTRKHMFLKYDPVRYYAMWGDMYKSPYYTMVK